MSIVIGFIGADDGLERFTNNMAYSVAVFDLALTIQNFFL